MINIGIGSNFMKYEDIVKNVIKYKYLVKENCISHICYGIDDNYARCVSTSIASICINNSNRNFEFHILIDEIKERTKINLKKLADSFKININIYLVNKDILKFVPVKEKWGISTYYRIFFPLILRNMNKIFYFDADVICLKEADEFFDIDLNGKIIGAVSDSKMMNINQNKVLCLENHIYFNAGVNVIDVKKWNDFNIFERFLKEIEEKKYIISYGEQDILNIILKGNIKYLDNKYNCKSTAVMKVENIVFYHFSAQPKPWDLAWKISPISNNFNRDLYDIYEKKTPYKDEPLVYPKKAYQIRSYVKALIHNKQYLKAIYWLIKYFIVK